MTDKNMTERSGKDTPQATKVETILRQLVNGKSLNRFEAEHHHDHCLNTTISTLQNGRGIIIDRKRENVPCLEGTRTCSVNRYWLNTKADNVMRARALLNQLESRA